MRVIAVSRLRSFWARNPDAEQSLESWTDEVRKAIWNQPADVRNQYRSASILKNRRVVIDIKGNDCRLVVSVAYRYQAVYVKFVGTHAEYDAIDADPVELEHGSGNPPHSHRCRLQDCTP
jgi:mRNA interferase HigB